MDGGPSLRATFRARSHVVSRTTIVCATSKISAWSSPDDTDAETGSHLIGTISRQSVSAFRMRASVCEPSEENRNQRDFHLEDEQETYSRNVLQSTKPPREVPANRKSRRGHSTSEID